MTQLGEVIINDEQKEQMKIKQMNIYEKMSLITNEIGIVEKKLNVEITKTKSYKAVSERDVLDAVKPIENKYRVYSYPYEREIIESDTLEEEKEYNGMTTKTNKFYLRLQTTYRFVNLDNPNEFIDIKTYGDGIDSGDKATGKAMTYGDKYALLKAYKMSTGDDPDKEASPEKGYKKSKTIIKQDSEVNLDLTKRFVQALNESGQDLDKLLQHYEVDNYNLLTDEQKEEAIIIMNGKIKRARSLLDEAEDQLKEEGKE